MEREHFPEVVKTARLRLVRHELVRAEEMFGLIDADRARLSEHLPWVAWTQSAEDEREYVRAVQAQWDKLEFFDYAMFNDETYMGNIGVHSINWHVGTVEIGYWILGSHEGRGFVTEACAGLVDLCFERGFHRVEIRCDPANERSARIPRRLGFRLEACLRENGVDQFGRHHDTLVFARLADDAAPSGVARPECIAHWSQRDEGPQSYYPESLETFGGLARLTGALAGFEVEHHVLPPGRRAWWPHAERDRDVCIFVLEGRPELWLDGHRHALVSGDVVTLARATGTAHTLINDGTIDARVLVVRSREGSDDAVHFPLHPTLRARLPNWWPTPPERALGAGRAESTLANSPSELA